MQNLTPVFTYTVHQPAALSNFTENYHESKRHLLI